MSYFFEEGEDVKKIIGNGNTVQTGMGNSINNSYANEIERLKEKIELLQARLKDKDERIKKLKEMIEFLKNRG